MFATFCPILAAEHNTPLIHACLSIPFVSLNTHLLFLNKEMTVGKRGVLGIGDNCLARLSSRKDEKGLQSVTQ